MNPFEFLLLLIGMVFIFQLIKAKGGLRGDRLGGRGDRQGLIHTASPEDQAETRMLRDEVRALKERIQVLERITVEKENSLAREIEDLRNR
ncbi:hypothetical protein [Sphingomonas astaxanthinifaciens]|uniref:Phage shock protein B n=1 Tax=Sphingomonas astaxanthinifaciens DSM 22298 TaxID=1123267 RepID=A0ABQ5Z8Y2_9SPHN|nr:hypothetical protein [Sphingomonas astaxanthinifaciens]GLR48424.1 hypothetical protein GCM10007925_21400 [Sphingomonas astaxanthinifaciens DSM 22298]